MSAVVKTEWRRGSEYGIEFVILTCAGESAASLEAWIAPDFGSNLCRLTLDGTPLIDYEPDVLLRHGYTGTPVLYPTPNQVRDAVINLQGESLRQTKRGKPVLSHGLVHDEAWEHGEPKLEGDSVAFETWIDFDPANPLFEAFPFCHRLSICFRLKCNGITISYSIRNLGDRDIPFGFGLHPYFMKLSGESQTMLTLPTKYVMENAPDNLPTGKLLKTAGTACDLNNPVSIGSINMNHVFTGISSEKAVRIDYMTKELAVIISATSDFSHLVVFSPKNKNYFCVENQTCSIDAHNLYNKGFTKESGLKLVPPGKVHSGFVSYTTERM